MYHTNKQNQVPEIKKSFFNTSFSQKEFQIDDYTPKEQEIIKDFLLFGDARRKNSTIGSRVRCSNKTVTRTTNKLLKDGLITKQQENKYAPNDYTVTEKLKKSSFFHWINSLSQQNQYLYITHGIRIDHSNKIIYSLGNVPHYKSSLILDSLFSINVSGSSHAHTLRNVQNSGKRVFNKIKDRPERRWNPQKGIIMNNFDDQPQFVAKSREKKVKRRYTGGHSPMVLKPVLPLDDQIHSKKVDIAFYKAQLEKPEAFLNPRSILFEGWKSAAKNFLLIAERDLKELEAQKSREEKLRSSNEKESILRERSAYSMEACSA